MKVSKLLALGLISFWLWGWVSPLPMRAQEKEPQVPPAIKVPVEKTPPWWQKFEVEIHYGQWTLDPIKGLFEEDLKKDLGKEIRKEVTNQLRESHPSLQQTDYTQTLVFDSGGSNFGLEVRYYPHGQEGGFSFGFSIEKTTIRLSVDGDVKQNFNDGTHAQVDAYGSLEISPWTTNISLRWDLRPGWRITPYAVLGFGLGTLTGEMSYEYSGRYRWGGPDETVEDSETKTLKEAEEDVDFNIPNIFFLLQTHLGVRVKIIEHLHLRVEAGLWDGLLFRGGLAYRF